MPCFFERGTSLNIHEAAASSRPLLEVISVLQFPIHRQVFEPPEAAQHAKMPAENFPAAAFRVDRTPRPEVRDRFADRLSARKIPALLSFGPGDASRQQARKSKEEKHLPFPATHPRRIPQADNAGRSRPPSAPVRLPQSYCAHVHPLRVKIQQAALSEGSRPTHRSRNTG